MKLINDVPIPDRMKHLRRDERGYPIPVMALIQSDGKPIFNVNDEAVRQRVIIKDLCSLCGSKLYRGHWFAGGPASAFTAEGVYVDPPMHAECVRYAMQVCPWLAAPNYSRRIDDKKVDRTKVDEKLIITDPTMIPNRPRVFVVGMAVSQDLLVNKKGWVQYIRPHRPFHQLEFWAKGKKLTPTEGQALVEADLKMIAEQYLNQPHIQEQLRAARKEPDSQPDHRDTLTPEAG